MSTHVRRFYDHKGNPVPSTNGTEADSLSNHLVEKSSSSSSGHKQSAKQFPPLSLSQRAYLNGILHKPQDAVFLFKMITMVIWSMVRLHCLELPFLIVTRFKYATLHHPANWNWWMTMGIGMLRAVANQIKTVGQVRFAGHFMEAALPLQLLFVRNVKVKKSVSFKVNREILLRYENASLQTVRERLANAGHSADTMSPSQAYLESMHPPHMGTYTPLANMPEEVAPVDADGNYKLVGEWIEALVDPKNPDPRPRSKTVVLYAHGGGHVFLSPASHRDFLARLAKEIGPGTRVFSVDYRMPPEAPFPSAIHDMFAAYLYLTQPGHAAITLTKDSLKDQLPVDPRDIVVGGDSAGGNLMAAFMLYFAKYIQPSASPPFVMPHAALLLSAWADPTSSLPAANSDSWMCYCPGPIGSSPFDKKKYTEFKMFHFASNYVVGDHNTVPNARNGLGLDRRWEWYRHLAQHPLVAPVHRASLSGVTNTLIHTATHDRLVDDNRLYAHRLGLANPGKLTRIEVYKDQVHVHQVFAMVHAARVATKNLARFVHRSKNLQEQAERRRRQRGKDRSMDGSYEILPDHHEEEGQHLDQGEQDHENEEEEEEEEEEGMAVMESMTLLPKYMQTGMVKTKAADNVEWVIVEESGRELAKDEGWPLSTMLRTWPINISKEA